MKLDLYIIRKFLGTFFFAIGIVVVIAVVFDFSEKIDDFMESKAPAKAVIFDYYLNFIPYFATLFSPMFTFIAVIYFTSKMAFNTEIIAILSSGISFNRILVPYFISASFIAVLSFGMTNFVIPKANAERFEFEEVYYHNRPVIYSADKVHRQIKPGIFIYFDKYRVSTTSGSNFTIEHFDGDQLISKLFAKKISWNESSEKWKLTDYYIRDYMDGKEIIREGKNIDTTIVITPDDFTKRDNVVETMSLSKLNEYIDTQRMQGATNVNLLIIEKNKRLATPFSAFILTLIGVSVSSRKVRGGIGGHIFYGLMTVFGYIMFQQFSTQFAVKGNLSPLVAAWLPNVVFSGIALLLYKNAPK